MHKVVKAALSVAAEGVVVLPTNCEVAATSGVVKEEKLVSWFNVVRKSEQPELMPVGMRGCSAN